MQENTGLEGIGRVTSREQEQKVDYRIVNRNSDIFILAPPSLAIILGRWTVGKRLEKDNWNERGRESTQMANMSHDVHASMLFLSSLT